MARSKKLGSSMPRGSATPSLFPATLNGGHGGQPATTLMTSSGASPASIRTWAAVRWAASSSTRISGRFALIVARAAGNESAASKNLTPAPCSSPKSRPIAPL